MLLMPMRRYEEYSYGTSSLNSTTTTRPQQSTKGKSCNMEASGFLNRMLMHTRCAAWPPADDFRLVRLNNTPVFPSYESMESGNGEGPARAEGSHQCGQAASRRDETQINNEQ